MFCSNSSCVKSSYGVNHWIFDFLSQDGVHGAGCYAILVLWWSLICSPWSQSSGAKLLSMVDETSLRKEKGDVLLLYRPHFFTQTMCPENQRLWVSRICWAVASSASTRQESRSCSVTHSLALWRKVGVNIFSSVEESGC